ncbi:MAG: SdpI family protein [Methanoregula sp.]|nr:SdpI family protein [Methanoregula sp.]
MHVANIIWNAMGWCPMEAAVRYPVQSATGDTQKKDTTGDGGPVARRSARFMRLSWGVVILAWVIAFLALPYLPDIIPVHWDLNGEANGFSDRLSGAFGVPVFITLITVLLILLPRFNSMQYSLEAFRDIYAILIFASISMLFGLEVVVLLIAAGTDLPVVSLVSALIGFLFIVMGSLMPYIGRNTTMGIRLPWTLKSEEVWKKTHEHGGPVFVIGGVLVVFGSIIAGTWALALMLVIVTGISLYITVWSYRLARILPSDQAPAQDP